MTCSNEGRIKCDYETLPLSNVFSALLNIARLLWAQQKFSILRKRTEALAISSIFTGKYLNIHQEQEIWSQIQPRSLHFSLDTSLWLDLPDPIADTTSVTQAYNVTYFLFTFIGELGK